jgi:hypothetical protein
MATGAFLVQRVTPVGRHAGETVLLNQFDSVALRVSVDGFVPILPDEGLAARLSQPFEGPIVLAAEIVNADHLASLI